MSYPKVNLIVKNNVTYIEGNLDPKVREELRKTLGYIPEDAAFKIKNSNNHWDGIETTLCYKKCRCPIKKTGMHFPTGLFSKTKDFFKLADVPFDVYDGRDIVEKTSGWSVSENMESRDYQINAANVALERQRGILKMATGAGKTIVAARMIANAGVFPFIFYVTSIDLMKQAKSEFSKFLRKNGKIPNIGQIGDGVFDPQDITIMTIQTAVKACGEEYEKFDDEEGDIEEEDLLLQKRKNILEIIRSAKGTIQDECQHACSKSVQIVSDYSENTKYKWACSATPFRDKNDDILIEACYGKTLVDISASYLIERGYLIQPDIYFVPIKQGMPTDCYSWPSFYKSGIVENTYRNNIIANITKTFYDQNRNILILIKNIEHGNMLQKMIDGSFFLHGKHTGEEREEHLNKMRSRENRITIGSVIYDEGIDCKALDTVILAGGGKSQTRALQRIGRILRPYTYPDGSKKTDAIAIDFEDHSKYLLTHSRKRKKIYKTEPKFNIKNLEI